MADELDANEHNMDGFPFRRNLGELHQIADGLGVPWDTRTLGKIAVLHGPWQTFLRKEHKLQRQRNKAENAGRGRRRGRGSEIDG